MTTPIPGTTLKKEKRKRKSEPAAGGEEALPTEGSVLADEPVPPTTSKKKQKKLKVEAETLSEKVQDDTVETPVVKKSKTAKAVKQEALPPLKAEPAPSTTEPADELALSPTEATPSGRAGSDVPAQLLLIPIAKPLADEKLTKRVFKLVKKASKRKQAKRGVKEVVKAIRKKFKGICVLAGDTSPIDVISHLPILCEDNDIPYVFVTSKEGLGAAGLTKRPTCCMLLLPKQPKGEVADDDTADYTAAYAELLKRVQAVQPNAW